ncbi:MAG: isopenicillin N synthase family dioxygenase, partial [Janthinobacterium lividum]
DRSRALFALPLADRQALDISRSDCRRGYEAAGSQVLDPGSPADLKESFMLARDLPDDHPYVVARVPHQGRNQWPAQLPGFREQMLAYQEAMIRLGRQLIGLLAMSVELPFDYFADGLAEAQCGVRLLRYPPQVADDAFNRLGAGAHSDWGSITILLQDAVAGLEVLNADGDWLLAVPLRGSFVINIGQMMERFTAGLYKANLHRVRNGSSVADRYSVATFFELDPLYRMRRAPTCRANDDGPDAPDDDCPLTIGEHIEAMARASYGGR